MLTPVKEFDTSEEDVVVMFHAPWAAPSIVALELFEQLDTTKKKIVVSVDDTPHIAEKYGVRIVPSFYTFTNGVITKITAGVKEGIIVI